MTTRTDSEAPAGLHDDPPETTRPYPALGLLERAVPPLRYGALPVWDVHVPTAVETPLIPAWNWHAVRDFVPGTETLTLATNGAYLQAIGRATLAHGHLQRIVTVNPRPHHTAVMPGYYHITIPHWAFGGAIVSPLGDTARLEADLTVWVTAPTLRLLLELDEYGAVGQFDIIDSYQALKRTSFRAWYEKLRGARTQILFQMQVIHPDGDRQPDCPCLPCSRYRAFNDGVRHALAQLADGSKAGTHRPDWAHTVHATHAANQWRKAWNYTVTDLPLVGMPHVDEIRILRNDLQPAMHRERMPFLFDASGLRIGAVRDIEHGHITDDLPVDPEAGAEETETAS